MQIERTTAQMMPGGWFDVEEEDPTVREIANFAHSTIMSQSNSDYVTRLDAIRDAQKQVVSGFKYRMTLDIKQTTCRKFESNDLRNCEESSSEEPISCTVVVWDQPWLQSRKLLSAECVI